MAFVSRRAFAAALGAAVCLPAASATPGAYPERPLKLVVPFTAGAIVDALARLVAEGLAQRLKVPVIVENRPGAGSQIGIDAVAKAPSDGYTLLFATSDGLTVLPAVRRVPYDTQRDFVPVARVANLPNALAVSSKLPVRTLEELIAYAKSNPGKLRYGTVGDGSFGHITTLLLESLVGIEMLHVPYKGMAPILNDLLAGHIDMAFATPSTLAAQLGSDRIRILVVTSQSRNAAIPDVPSVVEVGLPALEAEAFFGIFAPSGTPKPIVERLAIEVNALMQDPKVATQMRQKGIAPAPSSGAVFAESVGREVQHWKSLVNKLGLKVVE